MKHKKEAGCALLAVIFIGLIVTAGLSIRSGVNYALQVEMVGHDSLLFFQVLEMYTDQEGRMPASMSELQVIDEVVVGGDFEWPRDAEDLEQMMKPNFGLVPSVDKIEEFAPGIQEAPPWARRYAQGYWESALEHCRADD